MVFNDAADNGQTQARAALLGGEVRQEKSFFQFLSDSMAGIGDRDFDGIPAGHQRSGNLNFAHQRVLHGLGGIVYKIGQGALDGFGIGHNLRQVGSQKCLHSECCPAGH